MEMLLFSFFFFVMHFSPLSKVPCTCYAGPVRPVAGVTLISSSSFTPRDQPPPHAFKSYSSYSNLSRIPPSIGAAFEVFTAPCARPPGTLRPPPPRPPPPPHAERRREAGEGVRQWLTLAEERGEEEGAHAAGGQQVHPCEILGRV